MQDGPREGRRVLLFTAVTWCSLLESGGRVPLVFSPAELGLGLSQLSFRVGKHRDGFSEPPGALPVTGGFVLGRLRRSRGLEGREQPSCRGWQGCFLCHPLLFAEGFSSPEPAFELFEASSARDGAHGVLRHPIGTAAGTALG